MENKILSTLIQIIAGDNIGAFQIQSVEIVNQCAKNDVVGSNAEKVEIVDGMSDEDILKAKIEAGYYRIKGQCYSQAVLTTSTVRPGGEGFLNQKCWINSTSITTRKDVEGVKTAVATPYGIILDASGVSPLPWNREAPKDLKELFGKNKSKAVDKPEPKEDAKALFNKAKASNVVVEEEVVEENSLEMFQRKSYESAKAVVEGINKAIEADLIYQAEYEVDNKGYAKIVWETVSQYS